MKANINKKEKFVEHTYDFKIIFDKLKEEIENQPIEIKEDLLQSNKTIETIALFRDFQETISQHQLSFYSKS